MEWFGSICLCGADHSRWVLKSCTHSSKNTQVPKLHGEHVAHYAITGATRSYKDVPAFVVIVPASSSFGWTFSCYAPQLLLLELRSFPCTTLSWKYKTCLLIFFKGSQLKRPYVCTVLKLLKIMKTSEVRMNVFCIKDGQKPTEMRSKK